MTKSWIHSEMEGWIKDFTPPFTNFLFLVSACVCVFDCVCTSSARHRLREHLKAKTNG